MKQKPVELVVVLGLFLMAHGCIGQPKGKVVARFDGGVVTEAEFTQKLSNLPKELQSVALRKKREFLEEMVNEKYLYEEAKKRNLEKQKDVKELLDSARKKIVVAKLIDIEVDQKASLGPEEAQKYYDSHQEEFMTPLLLRASHILVKTETEANSIKADLASGADFEQLARAKSIDNTALRGGDLGFFQKGQLIPEFEEAAFQMQKGALSPVIKTQFGYHIIKLTDRAEPSLRDFKLVKGLVERQLLNEKRAKIYQDFVSQLKGRETVMIDEKALESVSIR